MKVRTARPEDFEAIVAIGRELHAKSDRAHLEFDVRTAYALFERALKNSTARAFVAEVRGRIVGFTVGVEHRWAYLKGKYVTDLVLFSVHPGAGRALIRALESWACEREADELLLAVSFGGRSAKSAGPLYQRAGMKLAGGMYSMNLEGKRHVRTR